MTDDEDDSNSNSKSKAKKAKLSSPEEAAATHHDVPPPPAAAASSSTATPPTHAAPPVPPERLDVPLSCLEARFKKTMVTDQVPILSSWDNYKQMLPVQEADGKNRIIAELPFWARAEEVTSVAKLIEDPTVEERVALPYLSAPPHSGKTASILMGFLESYDSNRQSRFTHYLYFAFSNNLGKHFSYAEKTEHENELSIVFRERQGAHFAFQCVRHLLVEGALQGQKIFDFEENSKELPSVGDKVEQMNELLKVIPGQKSRILFHVDEHQKMSADASFRRGALTALARCQQAMCVTTYTEIPSEVPAAGSSEVCRRPVPVPVLDITQVFNHIPQLNILSVLQPGQGRAWATLVFKLALHVRPIMLKVHLGTASFLNDFNQHRERKDIPGCLSLCTRASTMWNATLHKGAVKLMVGIADYELERMDFKLPAVTVANGMITGTMESILRATDPDHQIYGEGRQRFCRALNEPRSTDMLAATPLEAAHSWSLSCIACNAGIVEFSRNFWYNLFPQDLPKSLQKGRLFPAEDNQVVTGFPSIEKQTVLYYADENNRAGEGTKLSHPLCDMCFLTGRDELVLIDVTGGGNPLVIDKTEKLKNWIKSGAAVKLVSERNVKSIVGIVLAPGADGNTIEDTANCVCAVKGRDARRLLGGLAQCWEWFVGA